MVALAHAKLTSPTLEPLIEPLVPQSHLRVQHEPPRHHAATSARALLPIVHLVRLESAARAEPADAGQSDRFLYMSRCPLVGVNQRPDLGFFGSPRMPDASCAR